MQLHQFSCPKGWSVEVVWVPAPRINRNHPGHYLQLGYHLLGVAASATAWITTRWHRNQLTWSPYVTTPSHAVYRSPGEWRNMEKPSLKSFGAMDVAHAHHTAWQRMFHLDALLQSTPSPHTVRCSNDPGLSGSPVRLQQHLVELGFLFSGDMRNDRCGVTENRKFGAAFRICPGVPLKPVSTFIWLKQFERMHVFFI